MSLKTLLILSTLIASSFAGCPNKCSGHGSCTLGDKCACQPRWLGPDCSGRQCAYGLAWVTGEDSNNAAAGSTNPIDFLNGGDLAVTGVTSAVSTTSAVFLDLTKAQAASLTEHAYLGMRISFLGTGISTTITTFASGTDAQAAINPIHSTIPKGTTYVINADANNADSGRHSYTECSSKGNCDRSTGECQCFPGYEGRGCRRQACPNDCSGHGMCRYNHEVNPRYTPHWGAEVNELQSQLWDYNKARQCMCDRGYEGYDCSMRMCPKGDDPLTDCDTDGAGGEVSDIQELSFATLAGSGYFTLTFTDMFNGNYTTRPIALTHGDIIGAEDDETAADIQAALMELPNFAIPNVTVTHKVHGSNTGNDYLVTFTDAANAGAQNLLVCSSATSSTVYEYNNANSQPRYKEASIATAHSRQVVCTATSQTLNIFADSTGVANYRYKENKECSGRGACDSTSGLCQCFEGFTGEACATQTVFF